MHVDRLVGQVQILQVLAPTASPPPRAPRRCTSRRDASRSAAAGPSGSRSSRPRSARALRSSGSGATARGPCRTTASRRRTSSSRCSAARPTASAGFSRLPASIVPPDAEPAPTSVWISSMKRIAFGSLSSAVEHLLDALLEVAAIARAGDQRAEVERVDLARPSAPRARRPRWMRSARPSASAVLPTPGSPTSSGLFLRRRHSTWTMRSSSSVAADQRIDLPVGGLRDQIGGIRLERIAAAAPASSPSGARRPARSLVAAVRDRRAAASADRRPACAGSTPRGSPLPAAGTRAGAAVDLLRARRGGVHHGALDDAIEAERRFGLDRPCGRAPA